MAPPPRIAVAVLTPTVAVAGLLLLAHAGPGTAPGGPSTWTYQAVTGAVAGAPEWLTGTAGHVTFGGLLVLIALLSGTLAASWWYGATATVAGTVLTGVGTVVAYQASEALKSVVGQQRPCRVSDGIETWIPCPPPGGSFPSTHAALAAALATGLVLVVPRLAAPVVPVAGLVAVLRVVTGVHYPHDVLAGWLLGTAVVVTLVTVLAPPGGRLLAAVRRSGGARAPTGPG